MGKAILVDPDIQAGEQLLKELDQSTLDVRAAFWFYSSDSNEWHLVIASPLLESKGPKEAYGRIQSQLDVLKDGHQLSLQDISLVSPDDKLVKLLRSVVKTKAGISHIRFTHNVVNGVLIEDAHIYRLL